MEDKLLRENVMFDAPVAGSSLTKPLGGRPHQQPPQYTTVEDAMDFYMAHFEDPKFLDKLIQSLKMNVKVTSIAHLMTTKGIMEGYITIDVAMLIQAPLMELIMYVAEKSGVKFRSGMEDEDDVSLDDADLRAIVAEAKADPELNAALEGSDVEDEPVEEEPTSGFLQRR